MASRLILNIHSLILVTCVLPQTINAWCLYYCLSYSHSISLYEEIFEGNSMDNSLLICF